MVREPSRTGWSPGSRSRCKGPRRLVTSLVAAALFAAGSAGAGLAGAPAAAAAPIVASRPALARVAAAPARPRGARALGSLAGSTTIHGAIALDPSDPGGLSSFATAVSTPGSPAYHHYLAPGQFRSRFGPRPATIAAVRSALRSAGVRVTSVSANGLLVGFAGRSSRVAAAFHTHFERFGLAAGGSGYAAVTPASLPSTVASSVASVVGLSDLYHPAPVSLALHGRITAGPAHPSPSASPASSVPASGGPAACPAARAAASSYGGLTDTQIAYSYGMNPLFRAGDNGSGQTVAVYELEPFNRADITTFDTCYFGAAAAAAMSSRLHVVPVDGGQQVGYGSGEAELDIEDVSAMAPGATIDVYEAPNSTFGALDEYNTIVSSDTAKVVTTSWGLCEAAVQTGEPGVQEIENTIFEQAAAQGQSIFAAAGDSGANDCAGHATSPVSPVLSVDDPGSQPYVTSVGGLTIDAATQPPQETVWNDGPQWGAGGGGISSTWAQPAWQTTAVPGVDNQSVISAAEKVEGNDFCLSGSLAGIASACRETPDVSAQADEFTGAVTVYYQGQWITIGGTSSATPLWAAMLTDINSTPSCQAVGGVGFANPALYAVASNPAQYQESFTDVTSGNNDLFALPGGLYPATTGYDMASGLGSPQVTSPGGGHGLAYNLCAPPATAAPTVSALSPSVVTSSGTTPVTVTGTGFESSAGRSQVTGVQVGALGLPTSAVTVESPTSLVVDVPGAALQQAGDPSAPTLSGGAGIYDLTVSVDGGQTSAPGAGSRLVLDPSTTTSSGAPVVVATGPAGGNEAGGNTVTVYGVGLGGATEVSFGGVPGSQPKVNASGTELTTTVPAYGSGTACLSGDDPSTDVCQVQVQVTTPAGTSATAQILPEYAGAFAFDAQGVFVAPSGTEVSPAPTEYDYFPTPTLTSATSTSLSVTGADYVNNNGGTVETITGTGLGALASEWFDVGAPNQDTSQVVSPLYISPTKDVIIMPALGPVHTITPVPVSVQTLGSLNSSDLSATTPPSNEVTVDYAPTPQVASVRAVSNTYDAGPAVGGTEVVVTGTGLAAASAAVLADINPPQFSFAVTTSLHILSNDEVTFSTPSANPGYDGVRICDSSGCSTYTAHGTPFAPRGSFFTYFAPGNPVLRSIRPWSGPAAGGTDVTLSGYNLGFASEVLFGTEAARPEAGTAILDEGSTTTVTVKSPKGPAGVTVPVRIVTLASLVDGSGPSPTSRFIDFTWHR